MKPSFFVGVAVAAASSVAFGGVYSGPTDTANAIDPAIPGSSPLFVEWANAIRPLGSGTYFAPRGNTVISTDSFNSLGDLSSSEIAGGAQPGYLTVTFPSGIRNGTGADFAVFENGFVFPSGNNLFAELAYVEVSSNGSDFVRFPSISTNTTWAGSFGQAFAGFDTTNIHNLAGKHAAGFGTPFNLDDLASSALVLNGTVNLNNIQYVRLVDIPGSGDFKDSLGNGILDNWLSTGTGGFDFQLLDGQSVGVINVVPEPATLSLLALAGCALLGRRARTA